MYPQDSSNAYKVINIYNLTVIPIITLFSNDSAVGYEIIFLIAWLFIFIDDLTI